MNPTVDNKIKKMPKVELHRHLEGSLRLEAILHTIKEYGACLPTENSEELKRLGFVTKPMGSLKEVLDRFDLARSCFVNREAMEYITYSVCKEAAEEAIRLLELRFSPDFIAQAHGHDFNSMLDSVNKGVSKAMCDFDMGIGVIIICSRELGYQSFEKTIQFAIERKDDIIGLI